MSIYVVAKDEREQFEFQVGKKVYKVPFMRNLPVPRIIEYNKQVRKAPKDRQEDVLVEFLASVFSDFAPGSIDTLSGEQFGELAHAYLAAGKAAPGESQASSD